MMSLRKRIALNALTMDSNKAGVGNYAYHVIKSLEGLQHEFDIDVYLDEAMCGCFTGSEALRLVPVGHFTSSKRRALFELYRLPSLLNRQAYDLVHFMDYITPLRRVKAPFVATVHDISFYTAPQNYTKGMAALKRSVLPKTLKRAQRIVTVSKFTKAEILSHFSYVPSSRVVVVPLGVDQPALDGKPEGAAPNNAGAPFESNGSEAAQDTPYILFVGTIEPRKNVITLIKASEQLWEAHPEICHELVIAGKYGWLYEDILEYAKKSKYHDRIRFTGYVDDAQLSRLYRGANLFVYPSSYEGFGLPPLEAMSYGVPVIGSNTSSIPEVLGDAALYANAYDAAGFAKQMFRLIAEPKLHEKYSQLGFAHSRQRSWVNTARGLLEVYRGEIDP